MNEEAMQAARRVLQKPLNWGDVLETSIAHAVSPLLYGGLEQVMRTGAQGLPVPAGILEELQRIYRASQVRSHRMYKVVGDIFKTFKAAGVQAMALKDVQLARVIYPEPGLRPMGDIDILIRQEEYREAARCMNQLGFTARPQNLHFTLQYAFGHMFHRAKDNVWVDLQWNILQMEYDTYHQSPFDFQVNQMWRRAGVMPVDDFEMLAPSPEDMLFHLCMHLEGHKYAELILFCDIAEFLRHYAGQLDWQYLAQITKKYGAESGVYYVLFFMQRLYGVTLPPSILKELEPGYFKANLIQPLYDNLTTLHLSLDGIQLSSSPPVATMTKFEEAARRQAAGAMHVARIVDDLALAFRRTGGGLIIPSGTPSQKIFPDPTLPAFETIDLFILEHELPCMRRALEDHGFHLNGTNAPEAYKESKVESVDPALASRPTVIDVRISICRELNHLPPAEASSQPSKRKIALKVILAKLSGRECDSSRLFVRFRVVALAPEALLGYLAARLGTKGRDRLFGLASLLEFFRSYTGPIEWNRVMDGAGRHRTQSEVCQGLRLVGGFLASDRLPAEVLKRLEDSAVPPRCLESARYDPESWGRYASFRVAFYYLLSLLSTRGARAKLRYFLRTRGGGRDVLPRLIVESLKSVASSLRGKRQTTRDFAYWMEADPASPSTHATILEKPEGNSAREVS
jgi:hypothetical protein